MRASVTSSLVLNGVRVPESAMLPGAKGLKGPLGKGDLQGPTPFTLAFHSPHICAVLASQTLTIVESMISAPLILSES